MARNLFRLGTILDQPEWKVIAGKMVYPLKEIMQKEPGYLSNWGILMAEMANGMAEIVIAGPNAEVKRNELMAQPIPFAVILGSTKASYLELLRGRTSDDGSTRIFVCYNKTCQLPVESVSEALEQLK